MSTDYSELTKLYSFRVKKTRLSFKEPIWVFGHGTTGITGKIEFDSGWDEVPYRRAVFIAIQTVLSRRYNEMKFLSQKYIAALEQISQNVIDGTIEIPAEILSVPNRKIYMSVEGWDVEPDADAVARRDEIYARLEEIKVEMSNADDETESSLVTETIELYRELRALPLTRNIAKTAWTPIARVAPGAVPAEVS